MLRRILAAIAPTPQGTTYAVGFSRMVARLETLGAAYADRDGITPGPDLDLDAAAGRPVTAPAGNAADAPADVADKRRALAAEFIGRPELLLDHALVVAILRRASPPAHVPDLFGRMWMEKGQFLGRELPTRWLVSAATTFADHGATAGSRAAGLALSTLFGTMQLYESERLYSGLRPDAPFPFGRHAAADPPLGLGRYSIAKGDLDLNMLGRVWREGEADPATRPLCAALLHRLNGAPDTVFRRLRLMRRAKAASGGPPA